MMILLLVFSPSSNYCKCVKSQNQSQQALFSKVDIFLLILCTVHIICMSICCVSAAPVNNINQPLNAHAPASALRASSTPASTSSPAQPSLEPLNVGKVCTKSKDCGALTEACVSIGNSGGKECVDCRQSSNSKLSECHGKLHSNYPFFVAAGIGGFIVVAGIVISCCLCNSCCPWYKHRAKKAREKWESDLMKGEGRTGKSGHKNHRSGDSSGSGSSSSSSSGSSGPGSRSPHSRMASLTGILGNSKVKRRSDFVTSSPMGSTSKMAKRKSSSKAQIFSSPSTSRSKSVSSKAKKKKIKKRKKSLFRLKRKKSGKLKKKKSKSSKTSTISGKKSKKKKKRKTAI